MGNQAKAKDCALNPLPQYVSLKEFIAISRLSVSTLRRRIKGRQPALQATQGPALSLASPQRIAGDEHCLVLAQPSEPIRRLITSP
jgi:hypothetical protein